MCSLMLMEYRQKDHKRYFEILEKYKVAEFVRDAENDVEFLDALQYSCAGSLYAP